MKNIVITGVSGFVGANLKDYLLPDFKVSGISRVSNINTSIYGFCDSTKLLDESEAFIHLAGKAHDLKNVIDEQDYFDVNSKLTIELFNQFLKSSCRIFIYMSSVKAVADTTDKILNETDVSFPTTAYGRSKLAAENHILSTVIPVGKSVYILRPCMIHGPGNKGNLNLLYKLISKGIPYPLASFENKRSFLSVENLCFVIQELLQRDDIPSGVYNVADDEAFSTNELIKLIAKASNRNPKLWEISPKLIRLIAKLGDLLKLPLTTERLNKLTENYIVDTTKIRHALGKELPVQARDGIIKTINSFDSQIKQ
jgi:nucleoside-diphosphate-sugar epimerase